MNSCGSPSNDEKPSVPTGTLWQNTHWSVLPSIWELRKMFCPVDCVEVKLLSSARIGFGGYRTVRMKSV